MCFYCSAHWYLAIICFPGLGGTVSAKSKQEDANSTTVSKIKITSHLFMYKLCWPQSHIDDQRKFVSLTVFFKLGTWAVIDFCLNHCAHLQIKFCWFAILTEFWSQLFCQEPVIHYPQNFSFFVAMLYCLVAVFWLLVFSFITFSSVKDFHWQQKK